MSTIAGRVWKFGEAIDTDLILPMHSSMRPPADQPQFVFEANRPGWAAQVTRGDIIVAGRNFGIGSARPAAQTLTGLGIGAVLADSVNGLFMRNAINFGLPCLQIDGVSGLFDELDIADIDTDRYVVTNRASGRSLSAIPLPDELKEIMFGGGLRTRLAAGGYIATG